MNHYFNGRGVTLTQTGHSQKIIAAYIDPRGEALKGQIAKAARRAGTGPVSYSFERSYDMIGIVFAIGNTTIGGLFSGQSTERNGILNLEGNLEIFLNDEFSGPLDIGEVRRALGNEDEDAGDVEVDDYRPGSILYDNIHKPLDDYLRGRAGATVQQPSAIRCS